MNIVLDTNVLIAALIARGVCADLLEHCVIRHHLVTSEPNLAELQKHLVGKFKRTQRDATDVLELFRSQMEVVIPLTLQQPICRDPDDDAILATAIAGKAKCIITGDKDLLVLGQHLNIAIVAPSAFADFEAREGGVNP
jgi:putative PIN family toxin of toxin-antitoxin system